MKTVLRMAILMITSGFGATAFWLACGFILCDFDYTWLERLSAYDFVVLSLFVVGLAVAGALMGMNCTEYKELDDD